MKKVLIISNQSNTATAFYRSVGPFSFLKDEFNIEISDGKLDWSKIIDCDVVFLENPYTVQHRLIFEICKDLNKCVWTDWSLNPFDIEDELNPMFKLFSDSINCSTITQLLKESDIVTVATKKIKDKFSFFKKDVVFLPNAFNDSLYVPLKFSGEKIAIWRSTKYYWSSLNAEDILDTIEQHSDWKFKMVVSDSSDLKLLRGIPNIEIVDHHMTVLQFNKFLLTTRPSVLIKDSDDPKYLYVDAYFNSSKISSFKDFDKDHEYVPSYLSEINAIRKDILYRL